MEPSWHHFGDHVDLLGRFVALSWLCWHVFSHCFDSLDVQTKKIATILASHVRVLLLFFHISLVLVLAPLKFMCPLHWPLVPLMCISSAPFNFTSHVQLACGTSHALVCASHFHLPLLNLTCTSDVHLLQHLSIASLNIISQQLGAAPSVCEYKVSYAS